MPQITLDVVDTRPGIFFTREQLECWAGRPLTDEEVGRLDDVLPNSSLPEVVNVVVDSFGEDLNARCGACGRTPSYLTEDGDGCPGHCPQSTGVYDDGDKEVCRNDDCDDELDGDSYDDECGNCADKTYRIEEARTAITDAVDYEAAWEVIDALDDEGVEALADLVHVEEDDAAQWSEGDARTLFKLKILKEIRA